MSLLLNFTIKKGVLFSVLFLFCLLLALLTDAALPLLHKQLIELTHLTNELLPEVITLGAGAEILL